MSNYFAHSENSAGIKHDLVEHLKRVAQLAAEFADKFGAGELGYRVCLRKVKLSWLKSAYERILSILG